MKTRSQSPFGLVRATVGALTLALLATFTAPQLAEASTAANTVITNSVAVNYKNTANVDMAEETASVSVTIQLVASTPALNIPADQEVAYADAATVVYNYTLTSTANGPDTYDLSVGNTQDQISGSTSVLEFSSLDLGATTLALDTDGSDTITVAYDGNDDGVVNGISEGDTIVISGFVYTVETGGITEDSANNIATIKLDRALEAAGSAADIVGEQQTFKMTVTLGTLAASAVEPTITVTVAAEVQGNSALSTDDETITTVTTTTLPQPKLDVTKEVSVEGGAFGTAAMTAVPGNVLTYRITVTNSNTYSNAATVVITDAVPQYTTYVADSAKKSTTTASAYDDATTLTGDSAYSISGRDITYNVGTIAPSASVVLFYQVTVD